MTKEDRERELSDIATSRIALGHLAGQLGGFVGGGESVKKAVKNAIKAYFDNNPHLKNDLNKLYSPLVTTLSESVKSVGMAVGTRKISELKSKVTSQIDEINKQLKQPNNPHYNSLPSPSPSADSDKLSSKLDALKKVEKLCEFYENLKTFDNNPKTLLDNLCDGLETFLGFNKDSKGYDGTGIVYSDLDRLCDGVMGFLSGVLEGVKDDDAVTTYDNYISGEDNKLKSVLGKLQSQIGSGRDGLVESVAEVREWLEKYNSTVEELTSAVTSELGKLSDKLSSSAGEYYKQVTSQQAFSLANQLAGWQSTVRSIASDIINIETYKINALDSVLKTKIMRELRPVTKVVEHLKRVSEKGAFVDKVQHVDGTFAEEVDSVGQQINKKCELLQQTLTTEFALMNGSIDEVEKKREKELASLIGVINKLVGVIQKAEAAAGSLETKYNELIVQQLEKVGAQVNGMSTNEISSAHHAVFSEIAKEVEELDKRFGELGGLGHEIRGNMDAWLSQLETELTKQVSSLKQHIKNKITEYVAETLAEKIGVKLLELTDRVAHRDGIEGYLDEIVQTVKEYALKYDTKSEGQTTIDEWMKDVLKKGGPVYHRLESYIKNKGEDEIKRIIKEGFESKISVDFPRYEVIRNDGIGEIVATVRESYETFAQRLGDRIKNGQNAPIVDDIANVIDTKGAGGTRPDPSSNHNLKLAIHTVLKLLVQKAKQSSVELRWFLDKGKIVNVQAAINAVKKFGDRIADDIKAVGDPHKLGNAIQSKLGEVAVVDVNDKKFNPLLKDAANAGLGLLNAKVNRFISDQLRNIRPNIEEQINKLRFEPSGDIQKLVERLQSNINTLQGIVRQANRSARINIRGQLEYVKEQVGVIRQYIIEINGSSEVLNEQLARTIQEAQRSLQLSYETVQAQIHEMNTVLIQTAESSFMAVKSAVQFMFAEGHKADLSALRKLVEAQKQEIERFRLTDKYTGLKGFLIKLYQATNMSFRRADAFTALASRLGTFMKHLLVELQKQADIAKHSNDIMSLQNAFENVLHKMLNKGHFHTDVLEKVEEFEKVLRAVSLEHMNETTKKVLLPLKSGYKNFVEKLEQQYVSAYSGRTPQPAEAEKFAKIFVTISTLLHDRFVDLYEICCNTPNAIKINKAGKHKLGPFFSQQGYAVAATDGIQHGELQNSSNMGCETTKSLLLTAIEGSEMEMLVAGKRTSDISILHLNQYLYTVFGQYFQVCHFRIPSKSKYPCTVRDMLSWICGLQYTAVVENVKQHCETLLDRERKDAEKKGQKPDSVICGILENELLVQLSYTCRNAYGILVTIQGHGSGFNQADYPYACNFRDNSKGFHYPSDVPGLFDMLADVCARLLSALYLLYSRCRTPFKYLGWYECQYGKEIQASNWRCTDHSNTEPNDKPNTKPNCQPKSPLQSHLMDGLPGCLPHKLTSVGCKSECLTCPKSPRGQPCVTPMGFWDLTDAASINHQGKQICKVLYEFCGNADSDLARLLRYLRSLNPSPPKTLGDMMSLYCQIFRKHNGNYINNTELETHLKATTLPGCFPLPTSLHGNYPVDRLVGALQNVYHSESGHRQPPIKDAVTPGHKDLFSLVTKYSCESPNLCAPYLHPLCKNAYHTYPQKHAALYASWLTQLAWDLWSQLDSLLNAFKHMSCKAYGCPCNCAPGKHGVCEEDIAKSQIHPTSCETGCHCPSIARCQGVLSLFYQYGFTFRVTKDLIENETKRTCDDFVKQMTKVLYDGYFSALFKEVDEFIFAIRQPFIWLTVALWSLSLFYLICVMVGRLDVLHIRSHLRTPSSHKITAQSLLAAAQVGRLAKISYLQP